jgi:predicted neutral ceramidase superfamily lipid hydrolase
VVLRLLFTKGQQAAIEQFVFLRNSFYLAFIFFSIIFGVLAILKKNFQKIIPDQVNGIILITFAYSLAKIVFDLLNYLFLLNLR